MEIIQVRADLVKLIGSIAIRGKRLDGDIHRALCSAVWHRSEHVDNTLIAQVVNAMPKGSRANAAIKWAEEFGGVTYSGRDKQKQVKFKNSDNPVKLDEGIQTPFWDMKAAEGEEYDSVKDLEQVIKILERRAKKAEENGETTVSVTYRSMVDQLKNLEVEVQKLAEAA